MSTYVLAAFSDMLYQQGKQFNALKKKSMLVHNGSILHCIGELAMATNALSKPLVLLAASGDDWNVQFSRLCR